MFALVTLFFSFEAGRIQISNCTNMLLDMLGGFRTEERGGIEIKVVRILNLL